MTTPLRPAHPARARANLPSGWASQPFTSPRFGYSLDLPRHWSFETSGPADRFALHLWAGTLPSLSVVAQSLPADTVPARWTEIFNRRFESAGCAPHGFRRLIVAGTRFRVSVYRDCGDPNRQSATFMHDGRGYGVIWRGTGTPPDRDYPLFDAILKSFDFLP